MFVYTKKGAWLQVNFYLLIATVYWEHSMVHMFAKYFLCYLIIMATL